MPIDIVLTMIEGMWVKALPGGSDQYGSSAPHLYALGEQRGLLKGPAQAAVITAIIERPDNIRGSGPLRVVLVTHWRMADDQWRFFYVLHAFVLGEEFLDPTGFGARGWLHDWERFQP